LRHTDVVLPSLAATVSIARTMFFFAAVCDRCGGKRASSSAVIIVPAHVRKSFAVNGSLQMLLM
jgi:hypothetical protein